MSASAPIDFDQIISDAMSKRYNIQRENERVREQIVYSIRRSRRVSPDWDVLNLETAVGRDCPTSA